MLLQCHSFVLRQNFHKHVVIVLTCHQVADLGISPFGHERTEAEITTYPKTGYQNAPKFCENTDKALATAAFYIPANLQSGDSDSHTELAHF